MKIDPSSKHFIVGIAVFWGVVDLLCAFYLMYVTRWPAMSFASLFLSFVCMSIAVYIWHYSEEA